MLCDDRFDNAVVSVTREGFHPSVFYIQKGQSVLWTWKGNDEEAEHNIIHVKSPDSDVSIIHVKLPDSDVSGISLFETNATD